MGYLRIVFVLSTFGCSDASFNQNSTYGKATAPGTRTASTVNTKPTPEVNPQDGDDDTSAVAPVSPAGIEIKNFEANNEGNDAAVPPNQVTGAYLHCAYLLPATNDTKTVSVGCRLDNATGNRILPSQAAEEVVYSFQELPSLSATVVMRRAGEKDAMYDAFFAVKDVSISAAMLSASSLRVSAELQSPATGRVPVALSGTVKDILLPAELPSTEWTEICSGGKCDYRDNLLGLFWSPSTPTKLLWSEAELRCSAYSSPNSPNKWRQPTIEEMIFASDHHILSSPDTINMGIIDWSYWTGVPNPAYVPGELWYYAASFTDTPGGSIGNSAGTWRLYSMCVRQ